MALQLKAGFRLRSVTDAGEVVVVRAPAEPVDLRCGGHPMVPTDAKVEASTVEVGFEDGIQLGKRYADEDLGIEILCTKPSDGGLSVGDKRLEIKGAKALPASD